MLIDLNGIDLKFTFSKGAREYFQSVHGEVPISIHMCMSDYLRCTKCKVHNCVCKRLIWCTKKRIPRFLVFDVLRSNYKKQLG